MVTHLFYSSTLTFDEWTFRDSDRPGRGHTIPISISFALRLMMFLTGTIEQLGWNPKKVSQIGIVIGCLADHLTYGSDERMQKTSDITQRTSAHKFSNPPSPQLKGSMKFFILTAVLATCAISSLVRFHDLLLGNGTSSEW